MRLILASASPRRAALLTAAGFTFDVRPVEIDETPLPREDPAAYVLRLAVLKAQSCRSDGNDEIVLAADTTVVAAREILGKPSDEAEARRMLEMLSGCAHEVLTGVAIRRGSQMLRAVEVTRVSFLPLQRAEVDWYVASGEAWDKAGAYGVQGLAARFVDGVDGSYSNVVGLPVSRVYVMLKQLVGDQGLAGLSRAADVLEFPVTD